MPPSRTLLSTCVAVMRSGSRNDRASRCIFHVQRFKTTKSQGPAWPSIAVVGSGPAGFYTARTLKRLLAKENGGSIDIFDQSPFPYGLVRFGVAPDHPEVKNCIHQFEQVFDKQDDDSKFRARFYGNVTLGKDIRIDDLQKRYTAVVLAYGAQDPMELQIPGAVEGKTPNYFTSKSIVGWYNGDPNCLQVEPDLTSTDTAIILGHGNVALDIARILLTPVDELAKTDITERALEALRSSKIKKVHLVGRRGPLQVGFTIKELRELVSLPNVLPGFNPADFGFISPEVLELLPRPKKRITELMVKTSQIVRCCEGDNVRLWDVKFLRSPLEIRLRPSTGQPEAVRFSVNTLQEIEGHLLNARAVATGVEEVLQAGLVVSAIGYLSVSIDSGIPFDELKKAVITDSVGRVPGLPRVYACGWCARGATGVLAVTQASAAAIAKLIVKDLKEKGDQVEKRPEDGDVESLLKERNVNFVSWEKWLEIDAKERQHGEQRGKPREKLVDLKSVLK